MTKLIPELDKLRNKEISFGCVITDLCGRDNDYEQCIFVTDKTPYYGGTKYLYINSMREVVFIEGVFKEDENRKIIGHPLTRGRINHLHGVREFEGDIPHGFDDARGRIMILLSQNQLFDQNELQRMQNEEVREKLKPLLVKFSNYL